MMIIMRSIAEKYNSRSAREKSKKIHEQATSGSASGGREYNFGSLPLRAVVRLG